MRGFAIFLTVAVVIIIGVFFIRASESAPRLPAALTTDTSPATSASVATTTPGPGKDCGGCRGLLDNNKTIAVVPTSRITLDLPADVYDKQTLTVTPAGSLGETFGASAAPGDWVRTFEASATGTAVLSAPSKIQGQPDYKLTIEVVGADNLWENGFTIVTPANLGQTLYFPLHERFLLRLGGERTVTLDPLGLVGKVPDSITTGGFNGVFETLAAGTTTLTAKTQTKTFTATIVAN